MSKELRELQHRQIRENPPNPCHPHSHKTRKMTHLNKYHIRQQDQTDCGVAALKAGLRYHGSDASLERLRELSGTSIQGTSMLGLFQAANQLGLKAEGFEADIENLKSVKELCILHVLMEERLQHYVVCYGYDPEEDVFLIGDPGKRSVEALFPDDLDKIWVSKALLRIQPTGQLMKTKEEKWARWNWLSQFVEPDMNLLGVALAIGIAIAILGLSTAIFSQKLLDDILPSGDKLRLFAGTALLAFLLLVKGGFGYIRQLFLLRQSKDFNIRIIDFFYGALLHLPKFFFDNRKTGDLIARMNDTGRIQRTISRIVSSVMIDLLLVLVATVAVFFYHWAIGLIALGWIPVFAWIVYRFHPQILKGQRQVMAAYAHNESNYVDTIQGAGEIKIANRQGIFSAITHKVYSLFQQAIFDLGKVGIRFNLATELSAAIFLTIIILASSLWVLKGILTIGAIIAILQMTGIIMGSAGQLAMANIQLQEARVAFDRMQEFTTIPREFDTDADQQMKGIDIFQRLEAKNLSFRFPGRKRLLEDISFEVQKGEMIAILGESGCGKSTLLQVLQKFYLPEEGSLSLNGESSWGSLSTAKWRDLLGVIPQQIKLFNGSLIDNILLGKAVEDPKELEMFMLEYGFDPYFKKFPNGYSTILGEQGVNISGGQQQIVALARALWHKPQLLLLDEPTAALDRNTERFVLDLLNKIKKDTAIILLTHRISTAKDTDRIYVIEEGRIAAQGDHHSLLTGSNLYADAWADLGVIAPVLWEHG